MKGQEEFGPLPRHEQSAAAVSASFHGQQGWPEQSSIQACMSWIIPAKFPLIESVKPEEAGKT
jgi:hypothetical protein